MAGMTEFVVVLTTLPPGFDAAGLADALVTARVAACVTILPSVQSVYVWKGAVQRDQEQQLIIKTTGEQVPALWTALSARHPYEVPEFVVVPIVDGNPAYLDWIRTGTAI
jgi:periplasmic divalent cation tolerance protein